MKKNTVPQDIAESYEGVKKIMYAVDEDGDYIRVASEGWQAEETVTAQALSEFKRLAERAREEFLNRRASPLMYHMYNARMDLQLLSHATGIAKFRIRRHMKVSIFFRLKEKLLCRYCDALNLTFEELQTVPEHRPRGDNS